jgi:hypothetical protein
MGVAEDIAEQYPMLAWLTSDPEIGPLLTEAVNPATAFSPERFQAKFMQTSWYRLQSKYAREREIQRWTDPHTWWADAGAYADELSEISAQFGRPLADNERLWLATLGLNQGVPANSATMRAQLRAIIDPAQVMQGVGTAGAAKNEIENMARGQWFAPLDLGWLAQAGISVATGGGETLESINARFASQAWHAYPHLRQQITEGQTMADIFQPYRAVIAEELELGGAENVSMNATEWSQLAQWRDPKTGEIRLPTMSEVTTLARSKPQWWNTSRGRQADAAGTKSLLEMFGKVK